jgi:hypothetical protein
MRGTSATESPATALTWVNVPADGMGAFFWRVLEV